MRYIFEKDDIIPGNKVSFNRVKNWRKRKNHMDPDWVPAPNTEQYIIVRLGYDKNGDPFYGLISSDYSLWTPSYLPYKEFIDFLNVGKYSFKKLEEIKFMPA